MIVLVFSLIFVWLVLLTFAMIGHNARVSLLQAENARLVQIRQRTGEASTKPDPAERSLLRPNSAVLMVSETCAGCDAAIQALSSMAGGRDGRRINELVVLTPDARDERVRNPLRLLKNDELYRSMYPGMTPALFLIDGDCTPRFLGVVSHPRKVRSMLRSAVGHRSLGEVDSP
jgi:hypothetical protein